MTAVAQLRLDNAEPESRAWASYDETKAYRYTLGRRWDAVKPRVAFIMLNPSTATEHEDDPTIRRCIDFAKRWGGGSLEVGNLFAYRSTDPQQLAKQPDPVGVGNDDALIGIQGRASLLIAAWGVGGRLRRRDTEVTNLLVSRPHTNLHVLGLTKLGQPLHPLYVPARTRLLKWPEVA